MMKVTNPIQTAYIRTQVDDEAFDIKPGESVVVYYDHRARRLKEVYPWLVLEPLAEHETIETINTPKV